MQRHEAELEIAKLQLQIKRLQNQIDARDSLICTLREMLVIQHNAYLERDRPYPYLTDAD